MNWPFGWAECESTFMRRIHLCLRIFCQPNEWTAAVWRYSEPVRAQCLCITDGFVVLWCFSSLLQFAFFQQVHFGHKHFKLNIQSDGVSDILSREYSWQDVNACPHPPPLSRGSTVAEGGKNVPLYCCFRVPKSSLAKLNVIRQKAAKVRADELQ